MTATLVLAVSTAAPPTGSPWPASLGPTHLRAARTSSVDDARFHRSGASAGEITRVPIALLDGKDDDPGQHRLPARVIQALMGEGRRPAVAFEMLTAPRAPLHMRHLSPAPRGAAWPGARVASAEAGTVRMVVADLPYARVWSAATFALAGYPIERAADGVIQTGWAERPPGEGPAGLERLQERVTVRVEPFGQRITRVTVSVEARGWQGGQWVPVAGTRPREHAILDGIRDAQDRRP